MIESIQTKKLADFLGVHASFISQIKAGHRKLPAKDCMRVSKEFDVSVHELRPDIFGEETT